MNFGCETKGASSLDTGKFFASRFVIPNAGVLSSLSVYLKNASGVAQNVQVGIYNDNAGVLGTNLIYSASVSLAIGFDDWKTINLAANLLLGSAYWLTVQLENSAAPVYLYYDAGVANQGAFKSAWTFGAWTDNPVGLTYSANKISIYATYTPVSPSAYSWFQMPKSQNDPETIEQAIARLILEHEADESAHLGTGESLESHKAAAIIDHLARSVYRDKLIFDRFQVDDHFSSLDSWVKSAGVTLPKISELQLLTTSLNGNSQYAKISYGDSTYEQESFVQNPILEVRVKFAESTGFTSHFEIGDLEDIKGYGFSVHDGNLYSAWYDDDEIYHETQITGIDITDYHTYRVDLSDGVNAVWYIDGVQKKTLAFINSRAKANYFNIYIINTVASAHYAWVQSVHYDEDYL